jgi:hypothetical protein
MVEIFLNVTLRCSALTILELTALQRRAFNDANLYQKFKSALVQQEFRSIPIQDKLAFQSARMPKGNLTIGTPMKRKMDFQTTVVCLHALVQLVVGELCDAPMLSKIWATMSHALPLVSI